MKDSTDNEAPPEPVDLKSSIVPAPRAASPSRLERDRDRSAIVALGTAPPPFGDMLGDGDLADRIIDVSPMRERIERPGLGEPSEPPGQGPAPVVTADELATALGDQCIDQHLLETAQVLFDPSFPPRLRERFDSVELLDSGATASVWRAYERQLERYVAIKVFDRGNRTTSDVLCEARSACAVQSQHVVQVLEVELRDDKLPAIIMELVAEAGVETPDWKIGSSAQHTRPESLDEAVRWAAEAAEGVHAAHLKLVSHRDLKPRNLMITPITKRAKVTDFGLATGRADVSHVSSLRIGFAGTPDYMAPEQALGMPENLDMRSRDDKLQLIAIDVFGLGALAYDLITGKPPYHSDDRAIAFERAAKAERKHLLHSRLAGFKNDRGSVPRRLAAILEKAMSREPAARYPSALSLAQDLSAWRSHQCISLDKRLSLSRLMLWIRRNPAIAAWFPLVMFVALAALVLEARLTAYRRELDNILHDSATQQAVIDAKQRMLGELRRQATAVRVERGKLDLELTAASTELAATNAALQEILSQTDRGLLKRAKLVSQRNTARRERDQARSERDQAKARAIMAESRLNIAETKATEAARAGESLRIRLQQATADRALVVAEKRALLERAQALQSLVEQRAFEPDALDACLSPPRPAQPAPLQPALPQFVPPRPLPWQSIGPAVAPPLARPPPRQQRSAHGLRHRARHRPRRHATRRLGGGCDTMSRDRRADG